jgi:hypothetical protein
MVYNVATGNQSLYTVRDLINPIANINFFIKLGDSGRNYNDEELANIIKAEKYAKAKQDLTKERERSKERLASQEKRVKDRKNELESLLNEARATKPGGYVNREDPDAVAHYLAKSEMYEKLCDKAEQAKERYEDALQTLDDKTHEEEEKVRRYEENLKPALDKDMVAFLGKLQYLVFDCFHNKALIFESFVLLLMAKKAHVFLYDLIEDNSDRTAASNTIQQLNSELKILVENNSEDLKQGFTEIVTYMHDCYNENEVIFAAMQGQLEQLPYDVCSANDASAHSLASLLVDTSFQYKDIIDPNELGHVEACIQERRTQFENNVAEIDTFTSHVTETFDGIAEVLADSKAKLQLIRQNKETRLGESFDYSRFALGVFEEEIQNEYLKPQQVLLEEMQLEIETSLGVNLTELIKVIIETELLSVSAEQAINSNVGFAFLEYRQKLQMKRQEFIGGISTLDSQLQDISQQPMEKAGEFTKQMQKFLGISVLPVGNLGALFPLHQSITKFSPALGSGHPVYAELREKTKNKLQGFFIAHAVIAVIIGGSALAVKNDQKPFVLGAAGTYGVSASVLFLKKKQLTEL